MATRSSILVWRIPWTEEPDRLQSIGLQRVRHNGSILAYTHINFMVLPLLGKLVWPQVSHLNTQSSNFLICKLEQIIATTSLTRWLEG